MKLICVIRWQDSGQWCSRRAGWQGTHHMLAMRVSFICESIIPLMTMVLSVCCHTSAKSLKPTNQPAIQGPTNSWAESNCHRGPEALLDMAASQPQGLHCSHSRASLPFKNPGICCEMWCCGHSGERHARHSTAFTGFSKPLHNPEQEKNNCLTYCSSVDP